MFDLRQLQIKEKKAANIFGSLEEAILQGRLKPGDQLPPLRILAEELGVNKNTAAVAYRLLQECGLVIADGRRGSVVAGPRQPELSHSHVSMATDVVRLHDGNPDPALLPDEKDIRKILMSISLKPRLYGEEKNFRDLLDWSRINFSQDDVAAESLFISSGALDAIERVLKTNLRVGDKVAIEDPGYMTTISLIRSLGLRPVGLAMDEQGILPESLRSAIDNGCRAVIFDNRAQNPTGIVTSKTRARQLKTIAATADGVVFINDDHSSLFDFAPYYSWHTKAASKWIVIRSFSKFLGPDFRVAVSAGDASTIEKLEISQSVSMGWVSNFLQRTVHGMLADPNIQKRINAAGKTYARRFQTVSKALKENGIPIIGTAGFNLWLPFQDEATLAQRLLARGWLVRSGSEFCISSPVGLRITTARMTDPQLTDFLVTLKEMFTRTNTTFSA
jgi:DNA-binding transcriptional MocR family regulator